MTINRPHDNTPNKICNARGNKGRGRLGKGRLVKKRLMAARIRLGNSCNSCYNSYFRCCNSSSCSISCNSHSSSCSSSSGCSGSNSSSSSVVALPVRAPARWVFLRSDHSLSNSGYSK